MTAPEIPLSVWILASLDPVLIGLAVYLGWRCDQVGKIIVAALAAFGISLLFSALVTWIGIPWIAPLSGDYPTLFPVRAGGALFWSFVGFAVRRLVRAH